jgi:hypothetical protein
LCGTLERGFSYVNKVLKLPSPRRDLARLNIEPIKVFIPLETAMLITLVTNVGRELQDPETDGAEIPLDIKRCIYKVGIGLNP